MIMHFSMPKAWYLIFLFCDARDVVLYRPAGAPTIEILKTAKNSQPLAFLRPTTLKTTGVTQAKSFFTFFLTCE